MDLLNWLLGKFGEIADGIMELLPRSPFVYLTADSEIIKILSYINWFIPIYLWISILESWLTCIFVWYVVQVVLRWIKFIE